MCDMTRYYPCLAEVLNQFNHLELIFTKKDDPSKCALRIEANYKQLQLFYYTCHDREGNDSPVGVWYDASSLDPVTNGSTMGVETFFLEFLQPSELNVNVNIALRLWPFGVSLWIPSAHMLLKTGSESANNNHEETLQLLLTFTAIPPHVSERFISVFVPAIRILRQLLLDTFWLKMIIEAPKTNEETLSPYQLGIQVGFLAPRFGSFISGYIRGFMVKRIENWFVLLRDVVNAFAEDCSKIPTTSVA
eukprot:m.302151 g.302151  ORF g.302151 m.302151 type:complete len:248 (+) comp16434_c0_seq4:139-882(+)